MEHDIHEMCERREKAAFAFVSFAHFASFVVQTLAPQAELRVADLGPLQAGKRGSLEHDNHEVCERREKVAFAFVSFAHFASFVAQTLTPQAEWRVADLGPPQVAGASTENREKACHCRL